MKKFKFITKVLCVALVGVVISSVFSQEALAATKSKSWMSNDGQTLYRASVDSTETKDKVLPITAWQNKPSGIGITLTTTVGSSISMSASSQFTGTASGVLVSLSGSIGLSVTGSISYSTQHSYNVPANKAAGKYRMTVVWPGQRVRGVVTAEPVFHGNIGVMSQGETRGSKYKKKVVLNDKTIQYAPRINNYYIDLQYAK